MRIRGELLKLRGEGLGEHDRDRAPALTDWTGSRAAYMERSPTPGGRHAGVRLPHLHPGDHPVEDAVRAGVNRTRSQEGSSEEPRQTQTLPGSPTQQARNLSVTPEEEGSSSRFLIHDRDTS
jgi:hypothetical protein